MKVMNETQHYNKIYEECEKEYQLKHCSVSLQNFVKVDSKEFGVSEGIPLTQLDLDIRDTNLEVSRDDVYSTSLTECRLKINKKNLQKVSSKNSDLENGSEESLGKSEEDDSDEDYVPNGDSIFKSKFMFRRGKGRHKHKTDQPQLQQIRLGEQPQQEIVTPVILVAPGEKIENFSDFDVSENSQESEKVDKQEKNLIQIAYQKACNENTTGNKDKESDKTLHIFGASFTSDYKCDQCSEVFDDCFKLKRHLMIHKLKADECSVKKADFTCYICTRKFPARNLLWTHMRMHSSGTVHKCQACEFFTRQISKLNQHKLICKNLIEKSSKQNEDSKTTLQNVSTEEKTNKKEYNETFRHHKCYVCDERFTDINEMREHKKRHFQKFQLSKTTASEVTSKTTPTLNVSSVDKSMSTESKSEIIIESDANKTQASVANINTLDLKLKLDLKLMDVKPSFKCCEKRFTERSELFMHMKIKSATDGGIANCNPVYLCDTCLTSFNERLDWYRHTKMTHKNQYEQNNRRSRIIIQKPRYTCAGCCRKFDVIKSLQEHELTCPFLDSKNKKDIFNVKSDLKREFEKYFKPETVTGISKNANDDSCIVIETDADTDSIKDSTTDIQKDVTLEKLPIEDEKDSLVTLLTDVRYRCDICYDEFTDHSEFLEHEAFHRELEIPQETTSQNTISTSSTHPQDISNETAISENIETPILHSVLSSAPVKTTSEVNRNMQIEVPNIFLPSLNSSANQRTILLTVPASIVTATATTNIVTTAAPKISTPKLVTVSKIMKVTTPPSTIPKTLTCTNLPKTYPAKKSAIMTRTSTSATFVTTMTCKTLTPTTSTKTSTVVGVRKITTTSGSNSAIATQGPHKLLKKTVTTPISSAAGHTPKKVFILNSLNSKVLPPTSLAELLTSTTKTTSTVAPITETATTKTKTGTFQLSEVLDKTCSCRAGTKLNSTFCECKLKVNVISKDNTTDKVIVLSDDEETAKNTNEEIVDLTETTIIPADADDSEDCLVIDEDVALNNKKESTSQVIEIGEEPQTRFNELRCSTCHRRFKNKKSLSKHQQYGVSAYRCACCAFSTCGVQQLKLHCKIAHAGNYMCRYCLYLCSSSDTLVEHLEFHKCKACNVYCASLQRHQSQCIPYRIMQNRAEKKAGRSNT